MKKSGSHSTNQPKHNNLYVYILNLTIKLEKWKFQSWTIWKNWFCNISFFLCFSCFVLYVLYMHMQTRLS